MVRNFEDRPLAPDVVERLLANARRGPSAGFTQGFELLVLEGREQTGGYWDVSLPPDERAGFGWPGLLRAPLIIVAFADEQAYRDRYAEPDKAARGATFEVPWWLVDTAFASLLVLLSAVDAGLGALFFGVFKPDAVRAAFGVPERYTPLGAIAIGYPAPDEASPSLRRGRRPLADVIHRGQW
jgi:nitroreductase